MSLSEADTRAKLIDPALREAGWGEHLISREETAGAVALIGGQTRRQNRRADYTLRLPAPPGEQPIAVALIEAKAEHLPPDHGLPQAKTYARALNVPFVFASNGHLFVEFDASAGLTAPARPLNQFPTPGELRRRYEAYKGFSLDSDAAKPLLQPYPKGETQRRYYQDAAIRATLEKIAAGNHRALLSMATGSGKTHVAVHLLKKIADAGQLRRALFVCDRDELRQQGLNAIQHEFGADAAIAAAGNPQRNARIIVATYQTLGLERDDSDASFLKTHYPENYFSHIIIDEAHRSAWGKWSEVLTRNPDAIQIGLTATPREFEYTEASDDAENDRQVTADNLRYFGEPVYEYAINQGIEDGYLALMEIRKRDIFLNEYQENEAITGVPQSDLADRQIYNPNTRETVNVEETRSHYSAASFERRLMLPERVAAMCRDLFDSMLATGGPEQKTIIFCAGDEHADAVTAAMGNLYARHCRREGITPAADYAFKCTAAAGDSKGLDEFKGSNAHHFIAATVDLLTTGVDVPAVRNIAFFRYIRSPIAFYQMIGRGTRIDPPTGKLMFRVYDYTNATRLFSEDFKTRFIPEKPKSDADGPGKDGPRPPETPIMVEGFEVRINDAGTYIMASNAAGQPLPLTLEQYKQRLAAGLVADIPALDDFRETWIDPPRRQAMLNRLPDQERAPQLVRYLAYTPDYDIYDVLADLAYGQSPQTREARADAFAHKNRDWLAQMPETAANAIRAIANQFALGGTENLENRNLLRTPALQNAGGLPALRTYGEPQDAITETKRRMFSA